jgi:hypothetical protein
MPGWVCARRASAPAMLPRGRRRPARVPAQASEALWWQESAWNNPLGTSGMIVIVTAATADSNAATGSRNDHDKHDKTGGESCYHPQPKPLVRFHRFSKRAECATVASAKRTGNSDRWS